MAQKVIRWLGGTIAGLLSAALLLMLLSPNTDSSIDPRSVAGLVHGLWSAGASFVTGALVSRSRSIAPVALTVLVASTALIGTYGLLVSRGEFEPFVITFVVTPGCVVGGLLGRR